MESSYLKLGNATFHYHMFGSGSTLLFCFHGYGRDGNSFKFLQASIGKTYTIIAIDLPFHGLTKWTSGLTFNPQYLVQLIQLIRGGLQKEHEKFVLLGFSMGGRIALHLTQILHRHIKRLVLIAPDGFSINFWHWFCTHTWLGNKLLGYTINHAGWVLYLLKMAERTGVINPTVAGFVYYYMHDAAQRKILYERWTTLRKFRLHLPKLKSIIAKQQLPVKMLFGLKDKIVLPAPARKFKKGIEQFVSVKVINETHYILHETNAAIIGELLRS